MDQNITSPATTEASIQSDATPLKATSKRTTRGVTTNSGQPAKKAANAKKQTSNGRTFTDDERAKAMAEIAARVTNTGCTFKDSIKESGISEQTYYQWKKLTKPAVSNGAKAETAATSEMVSDESAPAKPKSPPAAATENAGGVIDMFPDLAKLRQENLHLRRVLAEKLQSANDELRKMIASV